MEKPCLYRKRLIPEECILLKDDEILSQDESRIVTRWKALRPRKDLHHGYSCYFLQQGYKVSKFYGAQNSLRYWYCDIIDTDYDPASNTYVFTDLLADVIVYPDGFVKVVDLDELVTALDAGMITVPVLKKAISSLDSLLQIIYSDRFGTLRHYIEDLEKEPAGS